MEDHLGFREGSLYMSVLYASTLDLDARVLLEVGKPLSQQRSMRMESWAFGKSFL